ncbi:suppressor APC domain-containing protein 2 isoform X3 [Arapaima gigas]
MALLATDRERRLPRAPFDRLGVSRESARSGCPTGGRTMQPADAHFSTDGLPRAFLHSLRTLFDILDDGKRGYVHISEIESRWQGADTRDLPRGVLGCLRRVAPPHGCLSFERFVAGLRFSMLHPDGAPLKAPQSKLQPPGKVRPLGPGNALNTRPNRTGHAEPAKPGEPPRYTGSGYERTGRSLERVSVASESAPCRAESGRTGKAPRVPQSRVRSIESLALESSQLQGAGTDEGPGLPRSQSETTTGLAASRRHARSRDEQRRHTITNGVDYGMLKQMKELEQEKDSLLAGLDVVERAREWYQNQIHSVSERQKQMGQASRCTDFFAESSQSRMNILIPKLQEVNRCLSDLISCSGIPFAHGAPPATISSNPQPPPPPPVAPNAIQRLKEQNRLLTQEVTEKSERITQLEQEKSALIKQLFEARARNTHDSSALDSTFI